MSSKKTSTKAPKKTAAKAAKASAAPKAKTPPPAGDDKKVEKKLEKKAGGRNSRMKKQIDTSLIIEGKRQRTAGSRNAGAGAFVGGLVLGGIGGWAVGRSMSERHVRYVEELEAENRALRASARRSAGRSSSKKMSYA